MTKKRMKKMISAQRKNHKIPRTLKEEKWKVKKTTDKQN
jgi:hypothetical protein